MEDQGKVPREWKIFRVLFALSVFSVVPVVFFVRRWPVAVTVVEAVLFASPWGRPSGWSGGRRTGTW